MTLAEAAADLAAGLALLAAGAVTWARVPRSGTGPLLALAGAAWLAGDAWSALVYAHRGPLVHALLTYPSGRTRSPLIVGVIAAAYVDGLVPNLARAPWPTIALVVTVVGAATWRRARARGLERRACMPPLVCAAGIAGALGLAAIGRLVGADTEAVATWAYDAAIILTAGALAADLLSGRSVRAAATGLVIDLADRQEPRALRTALARTIGDPALEIAYRVGERWVDEAGQPMHLPTGSSQARAVTVVEDGGAPVAALVHDPAALRDTTLARHRSSPRCGWRWPTFACRPTSPRASATSPPPAAGSSRPATSSAAVFVSNCEPVRNTVSARYRTNSRRSPRRGGAKRREHSTGSWRSWTPRAAISLASPRACIRAR